MTTDERQKARAELEDRRRFWSTSGTFVVVILVCVAIWAVGGRGTFWPVWVILGLGIATAFYGIKVFGPARRQVTEEDVDRRLRGRGGQER